MRLLVYRLILVITVLLVVIASISSSKWLKRSVFFDQIYYGKSVAYGYTQSRGTPDWYGAGERARDLIQLIEQQNACLEKEGVSNRKYTIAIIGDSYVWGQGLTDKQRFASILEDRLSKYIDALVISLASPGDDLVANYSKYVLAEEKFDVDLYIFGLVHNDLLFNSYNHYIPNLLTQVSKDCDLPLFIQLPESMMSYEDQIVSSYDEKYGNSCVAKTIAGKLPKERALYFEYFETYRNDASLINEYIEILQNNGLEVLSATDFATSDEYQRKYRVSKTEGHPSYWANQIFAEVLEKYICSRYLRCV